MNDANTTYAEVVTITEDAGKYEKRKIKEDIITSAQQGFVPPQIRNDNLLPEMANAEKVRIRLTDGKQAFLIHPIDLTTTDIAILQKQLDQLALLIK